MVNATALTTAERLAGYMDIDTPTGAKLVVMESIINTVSRFVLNYTGIKIKQGTYTDEVYASEQGQTLNLKTFPIASSEPIILQRRNNELNEDDWETIDAQYYTVDMEAGIIQAMGGYNLFRGRDNYRVTYTAGYEFDNVSTFLGDTEVGDIELAVWMIASDFMNNKGVSSNIKREKVGDYDVTYAGVAGMLTQNPQALAILDQYGGQDTFGVLTPMQT